ncbi:MAG: DUF3795 domain-containing protein [Fidelibacterota bacterium]
MRKIKNSDIAPCGMNCGICLKVLRDKNRCGGCRGSDENKSKYCIQCVIINCEHLPASGFCYDCDKIPCRRLKQLDKRYRAKYHMSMLENLEFIKNHGLSTFVKKENERWRCPDCGGLICVHRKGCLDCQKNS